MNFIAHFHLSSNFPNYVIGNYLADMITQAEFKSLQPIARDGVLFHRFIDHFTDNHPAVSEMKKLFYDIHGKYSPVLVDIFMDYSLYKHWNLYSNIKFDKFCSDVYNVLSENQNYIPERLQPIKYQMIKDNWLKEYTSYEGLQRTFLRLGGIAKFSGNFNQSVNTYDKFHLEFDGYFNEFYPDILSACQQYQPSK